MDSNSLRAKYHPIPPRGLGSSSDRHPLARASQRASAYKRRIRRMMSGVGKKPRMVLRELKARLAEIMRLLDEIPEQLCHKETFGEIDRLMIEARRCYLTAAPKENTKRKKRKSSSMAAPSKPPAYNGTEEGDSKGGTLEEPEALPLDPRSIEPGGGFDPGDGYDKAPKGTPITREEEAWRKEREIPFDSETGRPEVVLVSDAEVIDVTLTGPQLGAGMAMAGTLGEEGTFNE